MKELIFHHLGYVVPSIKKFIAAQSFFPFKRSIFNFDDVNQNARISFYFLNKNSFVEIIEPLKEKTHFSNFLDKNPDGGFHHLCYESKNFENDINNIKSKGYRQVTMVSNGFESRRVVFFIPKKISSPLIEIISEPNLENRILPKLY